MLDWLFDTGWGFATMFAIIILAIFLLVREQSKSLDRECADMMTYARTSRDSLDARLACSKLKSDAANANAIAFSIGLAAGSNASRR